MIELLALFVSAAPWQVDNPTLVLDALDRSAMRSTNSSIGPISLDGDPVRRLRPKAGNSFYTTSSSPPVALETGLRTTSGALLSSGTVDVSSDFTLTLAMRPDIADVDETIFATGPQGGLQVRMSADRHIEVYRRSVAKVLRSQTQWPVSERAVVTLRQAGAGLQLWIDGTLDASVSSPVPFVSGQAFLGGRSPSSELFAGEIATAALYPRALAADEQSRIERSLASKTGVAWQTVHFSTLRGRPGMGILTSAPTNDLAKAIATRVSAGGGTVAIEAPESAPITQGVTVDAPVNMALVGEGGQAWYVDVAAVAENNWQPKGGGVYRLPRVVRGLRSAISPSLRQADGTPLGFSYVQDFQALGPGDVSLHTDGVYIRLPGDVNPNEQEIRLCNQLAALSVRNGAATLTVQNGHFRGGNEAAVYMVGDAGAHLIAKDSLAEYGFCGWRTAGGFCDARFERCVGRRNLNDGFNLHGPPGVPSRMLMIDCEGCENGDEGTSPHDNTTMIVQGGRFHHNANGGYTSVGYAHAELRGVRFDNNHLRIYDATEGGISFKGQSGGLVENCTVEDNNGAGLYRLNPTYVTVTGLTSLYNAATNR